MKGNELIILCPYSEGETCRLEKCPRFTNVTIPSWSVD